MADPERDEPSLELELPRLRLRGLRRKPRPEAVPEAAPEPPPVEPGRSGGEQAAVTEPETVADAPPPVAPELEPPAAPAAEATRSSGEQTTVLEVAEVEEAPPEPQAPRARPALRLPGGWPAVVVTGLVVGLVVVGLTWGSLRTCEAVQGTSSCGTAGYPMLALVLVLAVLVGSLLLRLSQVPDPVSTSLLGVGTAAVIALLVLIDHLDQPAMVVVIPAICAATFAGAHWLSTAVIEPDRG
jgi:hypothetical protein